FVNNTFLHRNNFNVGRGGSFSGSSAWAHDSSHRAGVPYASSAVASRYGGNVRQNVQARGASAGAAQSRAVAGTSGAAARGSAAGRTGGAAASERMGNRQV